MNHPFQSDTNFYVILGKGKNILLLIVAALIVGALGLYIAPPVFDGTAWADSTNLWDNVVNVGNFVYVLLASTFYGAACGFAIKNLGVFVIQEKEDAEDVPYDEIVQFPEPYKSFIFYVAAASGLIAGLITYF